MLALAVSGCTGGSGGGTAAVVPSQSEPPPPDTALPAKQNKNTCSFNGLTIDEEEAPLPGVTIAIVGQQILSAVSAVDGKFTFSFLDPGTYHVQASKNGFLESQRSQACEAGQKYNLTIMMVLIPLPKVPYSKIYGPQNGYIACAFGAPGVNHAGSTDYCSQYKLDPNGKHRLEFEIDNATTSAAVYELEWTQTGSFGARYLSYIYPAMLNKSKVDIKVTSPTRHYDDRNTVAGVSPVRVELVAKAPEISLYPVRDKAKITVEVRAASTTLQEFQANPTDDGSSKLVAQQPVKLWMGAFYNGMKPADGFKMVA